MGEPISSHHGVRCCPAIIKDTDQRYIVKIISIPSSQVQLDALLLTGACKDEQSALNYFRELATDVEHEAAILRKLSDLEGFVPYENHQVVPMEGEVGYDVYLLSPYKRSLERFFRKNTMTHLAAVNLGIDLCSALCVCRQAGFLYINLKPGNVYITENGEYRIGDLGFVRLDSLAYASMPERYRSVYTAPEAADTFATLNTTMDVYAVGMILYQAFNGGTLPFTQRPDGELPSPVYADYEIAEIICKACAADPKDRYQTPEEMGQALVGYMQRNEVNDVPIVPPSAIIDDGVRIPEPILAELAAQSAAEDGELAFMEGIESDETAPTEELAGDISYQELDGDILQILSQADELISHETPEGVVAPEPVEIPMPEPIVLPSEPKEPEESIEAIIGQTVEDIQMPELPQTESDEADDEEWDNDDYMPTERKSHKGLIALILILALLGGIAFGAYMYYQNYYLQNISDFTVTGYDNSLQINIVTDADEALLTAVCTDVYGNKQIADIVNGSASFDNLNSNTLYTVKVEIEGFHKLTGTTSKSYSTPPQTSVVTFSAIAGSEDGSVILSFTVDGQDAGNWIIRYSAEGEEEKSVRFSGHMIILNGLAVGKEYTFTLDNEDGLSLTGNCTLTYSTTSLVYAENLAITGCSGDTLTASWTSPGLTIVPSWTVRCYNNEGFDQTLTTTDTTAVFTGLDTAKAYTVEVIAHGMTSGSRCYVSANSITVTSASAVTLNANRMQVSWSYEGPAVTGNWLLMYSIDGSDRQEVIRCADTSAIIAPIIPDAQYTFTISLEDGSTVFSKPITGIVPSPAIFSGYTVTAENMTAIMVKTDDLTKMTEKNWQKLSDCQYATTTFRVGDSVSIPLRMSKTYDTSPDNIISLFVIRDEEGNLVSSEYNQRTWTSMWYQNNCTLTVPSIPDAPGKYTMDVYFNGGSVCSFSFEVVS